MSALPMTADPVARLRDVIAFLLGEAPLDGRWYGDEPPRGEGHIAGYGAPYWWRKPLREAASALRSSGEAAAWRPEGYELVAVKGFDSLVYWLDRCASKGHLDNCPDLIEPWEAFDYRRPPTSTKGG